MTKTYHLLQRMVYRYRRMSKAEAKEKHWTSAPCYVERRPKGQRDGWIMWAHFGTRDEAIAARDKANAELNPLDEFGPVREMTGIGSRFGMRTCRAEQDTIDNTRRYVGSLREPVFNLECDNASDLIHGHGYGSHNGWYADDWQHDVYTGKVLAFAAEGAERSPCQWCDCEAGPDAEECAADCDDALPMLYVGYVQSSDCGMIWVCAESHDNAKDAAIDADGCAERLAEYEREYQTVSGHAAMTAEHMRNARKHGQQFVQSARMIRQLWPARRDYPVALLTAVKCAREARKQWQSERSKALEILNEHGPGNLSNEFASVWRDCYAGH